MSDRTPADVADALAVRLEHRATQNGIVRSYGIVPSSRPEDDDMDRDAAVLLREQAEQLDTLRNAAEHQDVDLCAICGDVYCSGAYCLQAMVEELPDDHQKCGEKIESVQDLVRLGRILQGWLAAAGGGVPEEGASDE